MSPRTKKGRHQSQPKEPAPGPARADIDTLIARWGAPIDNELLILALTHRSFAHEAGGIPTNERLEFLGDAVLGVIVTEKLFRENPELPEGKLAKMRAATVSQRPLAAVARDIGLGDFILLGRGELVTGGREKDSILSDTLEALIGATYLCHGIETTRTVVLGHLASYLADSEIRSESLDAKTTLQELASAVNLGPASYEVAGTGPDHDRIFTATVRLSPNPESPLKQDITGSGQGRSKKIAEHAAAAAAAVAIQALNSEN